MAPKINVAESDVDDEFVEAAAIITYKFLSAAILFLAY